MKRLVVNADDYGMTESISKGILKAHFEGIVTSVSIVTNTPSFNKTISWVKDADIDKGIHLTLNSGEPLSSSARKLPIVRNELEFLKSPIYTPLFYMSIKSERKKIIYGEFKKQIEKLLQLGIKITHLDSHYHLHVFPQISDIIVNLINEYNIEYIRIPYENNLKEKAIHPVSCLISLFAGMYLGKKIKYLPFYGLTKAGQMDTNTLIKTIRAVNTDVGELMIHPGYHSAENRKYYHSDPIHLEYELEAAISSAVKIALAESDIKCIRRSALNSLQYSN